MKCSDFAEIPKAITNEDSLTVTAGTYFFIQNESSRLEDQTWTVLSSDIIVDELDRIVDMFRKEKVFTLLSSVTEYIEINEHIIGRARELEKRGVKPFDALHIASAEFEEVDVFLTTDKKLINSTRNADVTVKVLNPAIWFMEVLYNE